MTRRTCSARLLVAGAVAASCLMQVDGAGADQQLCGRTKAFYQEQNTRQKILASGITARGVHCSGARRVAHSFVANSHVRRRTSSGFLVVRNRYPKRIGRFRCYNTRIGSDVRVINCRRGSRSISFGWYDSSPYH